MASFTTNDAAALVSVHPQYAEAILSGNKSVEFRKRGFRRPVSHMVLYSTQPVGRVVGVCSVAGIVRARPADLWEQYEEFAGISHDAFIDYYSSAATGIAIQVQYSWRMDPAVPLADLDPGFTVPQSFTYLSEPHFTTIAKAASIHLRPGEPSAAWRVGVFGHETSLPGQMVLVAGG